MEQALRLGPTLMLGCTPLVTRAAAAAPGTPEVGGSVLQMLLGLALVVSLIFASLWLLKRLAAPRGAAAGVMRVVGGTAVGPRERVVLVEIGDTWLVLGVAPGRINALHQLARLDLASIPRAEVQPARDFRARLQRIMERTHAPR